MRRLNLTLIAEKYKLSEIETALGIYNLFQGNYPSGSSTDPMLPIRRKIYRSVPYFTSFVSYCSERSVNELLEHMGLTVNYWYCPNNGFPMNLVTPFIIRTIHASRKQGTLHLLVDRKDFSISNNVSFTHNLKLIIDSDYLEGIQNQCKTFLENVAIFAKLPTLNSVWPSTFSIFDERKFAKIFNFGFEIWFIEAKYCGINDEVIVVKKQIYKSTQRKFIILQYLGLTWHEDKVTIAPSDLFVLRDSADFGIYFCHNKWCFFNTTVKWNFELHAKGCSNLSKVSHKQICLTWETPKQYLIRNKLIPEFESYNFASFDIETLGDPENRFLTESTFLIETHKLVSIGIGSNFGRKQYKVFMRDDFSEESLIKIIQNFWSELVQLQIEHQKSFPPEFESALQYLNETIAGQPPYKDSILHSCKRYIENLFILKVTSFNGERFDLPIIFPALLKFWNIESSKKRYDSLNIVRRGLGIMSLDFRLVRFIDIRNYFPYGSLDQMGKIFKISDMKLCFPYQGYSSIEELKEATDWPPYCAFASSLKPHNDISNLLEKLHSAFLKAKEFFEITSNDFFEQLNVYSAFENFNPSTDFPCDLRFTSAATSIFNLDLELYVDSWIKFEELKILGHIKNMADYLKFYNLIDVRVTVGSFTRMVQLFYEKFNENLLEHPSLPGVAYRVLWNHFSTKVNKPFTFSSEYGWVAQDIRKAIQGGLTTPFHCHIEIGDTSDNYSHYVHHAESGKKFVEFIGFDAANLYGFSMSQELPTGQGILYQKRTNDKFEVQIMSKTKKNFSKEAINWLSWCQGLSAFKDHKIEHALNGGERKITLEGTSFDPDGYCEVQGRKHFFLYHGCFWHRHHCETSKRSILVRENPQFQERCNKIETLCSKYGVLHKIFGCEWAELKKNVLIEKPFSVFLEQSHVTESELINAINNDKLFGLIKCDIHSPDHVIERYMKCNFPPITLQVSPDESMIGQHIRDRMKSSKKKIPKNQLTQVSNILELNHL